MRAASLIDVLQGLGCEIWLDGGKLTLGGPAPPPAALMALLREHKRAIVHELRTPAMWSPADWRAYFHERAAILEHDAGLRRAAAEEEALQACFQLWSGRRVW